MRTYGHLIRKLKICGPVLAYPITILSQLISQYCTNLEFVDCFESNGFFLLNSKTTACSLPFPSNSSVFLTGRNMSTADNMMFCLGDCVMQQLMVYDQDLSDFQYSVWQFEIKNCLCMGYTASFSCIINGITVGNFTIKDSTVGKYYSFNLLFPIPRKFLNLNRGYLNLAIRCSKQLPFGAGYVCISSHGRFSLLKARQDTKYINPIVPPFENSNPRQIFLLPFHTHFEKSG